MSPTPEELAREEIDRLLEAAGWVVQDSKNPNLYAGPGVVLRELSLRTGHGAADYVLFVDGKALGIVEAKPAGHTLSGVEIQSQKYTDGFPETYASWTLPLPFSYQSTGVETAFTNHLEPDSRSRFMFSFHRPETLRRMLDKGCLVRCGLQAMPPLAEEGLWPPQIEAIRNLEALLAENKPRVLIQMATGSGKTFTACNFIYRLIKFAGAERVLFLVDRKNLGRQAKREFQNFTAPDDGRKFEELYNIQHLTSNVVDPVSRVCIATIQRVYSMLCGEELEEEAEDASTFEVSRARGGQPVTVEYNPSLPPEFFDVIVIDECHRSIYNLWRQVIEYFDAFHIGLTATPGKHTVAFFNKTLALEYDHDRAVADGVNVDYTVYRIRTRITEQGSAVDAGEWIDYRDRDTRQKRMERLDDDLIYDATKLDKDVVAPDQIRTVIRTFKDRLPEMFPGRQEVPKTLIFAKDDSHAEDIVRIVREEFGRGNDFCWKITYRTTGAKPEDLIRRFRTDYNPRIVVTVDMIATGTDVKPLEVVFFMRSVRSQTYFEQMKGRGVRVISDDDFRAVTPDGVKNGFIIVDAVGACEACKNDSPPLERNPSQSLKELLQMVALGNRDPDVVSTLAGRLARYNRRFSKQQHEKIEAATDGTSLHEIVSGLVATRDPDAVAERAKTAHKTDAPSDDQIVQAKAEMIEDAVKPLAANPELRDLLFMLQKEVDQAIDDLSLDAVLFAGFDAQATEKAHETVTQFREYIEEHKDEITALQILYSQPYGKGLQFKDVKELAETIGKPPRRWTSEVLWRAYEALDKSRVKGAGSKRLLTDVVQLVRFALERESELTPFADKVEERYQSWLAQQEQAGHSFTSEQRYWLDMIKDHITASLHVTPDQFDYAPFAQQGGLGKAYQLFGDDLKSILDALNKELAA